MCDYGSRGRLAQYLDSEHPATKALHKSGVAILRVCSEEDAVELGSALWDDLEGLGTGIERDDPKTWSNSNWPQTTHGLLQNQHFGLRLGVCQARLKCVDAFKALFKGATVNSSFDAVGVARPEGQDRAYTKEKRLNKLYGEGDTLVSSWLHIDQANGKPECLVHIQGAFALTDLGEAEQRTQFVIPKEGEPVQQFRDRFLAAFPPSKEPKTSGSDPERAEWISFALKDKVQDTDALVIAKRKWLIDHGQVYSPTLKAGEMILWDSGVPHASIPGPSTEPGQKRGIRMSTFVSMLPAELISEDERKARNEMLEKLETSGHRVTTRGKRNQVLKCKFNESGRTYGKELPTFNKGRVVRASKRSLVQSDEPEWSVAHKTQRLCAGAGL